MSKHFDRRIARPISEVWWLRPSYIALIWIGVLLLAYWTPEETYLFVARTRKAIDFDTTVQLFCGLAAFAIGSLWREMSASRERVTPGYDALVSPPILGLIALLTALTLVAYVIWLAPTLNGETLSAIINGTFGSEYGRQVATQISGVTTATQFGIFVGAIASIGACFGPRAHRLLWISLMAGLVGLALYRSLIWSERLALLEVIIPMAAVYASSTYRGQRYFAYLPAIALAGAIVTFGFFEFFRSWTFYSISGDDYVSFVLGRFSSYYTTSYNNAAAYIQLMDVDYFPLNTLRFVFDLPNPFSTEWRDIGDAADIAVMDFLRRNLNPEFNLFSAPGLVIGELGTPLGCAALFTFGCCSGWLYSQFTKATLFGVVAYSIWLVGLFDFGRLLYWTLGRAFPAIVAVLVLGWICSYLGAVGATRSSSLTQTAAQQ